MSLVLIKDPISETMHSRGGFPVKAVVYAVFILLLVYMFYIYNSSQNSLRESEMLGSRYKREAEERVTEIQELVRAKDRFHETCQNEKTELHNRIKSLNQQYSMVQSQYKETEADFIKLRQDMDTLRSEHSQADSAHAAEYEKLKQEKGSDIAKLKDDIADLTRQNQNLENTVASLRQKVIESEVVFQGQRDQNQNLEQNLFALQNSYKKLLEQNAQLQQQLQNRPQLPQQQPVAHPQDTLRPAVITQQPLDTFGNVEQNNLGLAGIRKFDQSQFTNLGHGFGGQSNQGQGIPNADPFNKDFAKPVVDDNLNALHQMRPPNNNNNIVDHYDDGKKVLNDVNLRQDVNPNDEQKAQILEPILEHVDKHQGGGEDGVVAMNVRQEEEAREKNVREEEADSLQHKNPLALGQIEVPGGLNNPQDAPGQNKKDDNLQLPPLLSDENEQKDQERGENHYFGEDDEAQQQQQQEDERHQMEEDEREENNDFENNVDRFPDDLGNRENKEAALADDVNN